MKIALVSTPWPLFNRPSIQLATLKAYLREHLPGAQVHAHHFYLNIAAGLGYGLYTEISESTRLSEIPYAALLFPELGEEMERLWRRATRGAKEAGGMALSQVRRALERESLRALESVAWDGFDLVGLSICLGQLTSSLYFIREIKRLAPGSRVVVGGSSCAGELGRSLMTAFPAIDHVIFGEGERPMLHLAREAASGKSVPSPFPGLLSPGDPVSPQGSSQVEDPDTLPMPDFDDYFSTLQSLPQEKAFHPRIPMEMSRGCWWRGADPDGERGCAFCNLNLQWSGYRHKSPARVAGELEILSEKYGTLSFSFMDNLLPAQGLGETCRLIRELDRDFRLFAEIRATTPRRTLLAMRRAGIRHVQVGIEALSTGLLRKLRKGTSAIANLEIMKHCETPEAPDLSANLILEFPSSDEKDVAQTLRNLDFALPFRPLKPVSFWLGFESPVWRHPARFGIRRTGNHPLYRHLFPDPVLGRLTLMTQGYHGGRRRQHRLWQPVREKTAEWDKEYRRLHQSPGSEPILSYVDGRDFLLIRHRRPGRFHMTHRLRGTSREIYLFCGTRRTLDRILSRFPGLGEERLLPFVRMMVEKRLMFREGSRVLSLAVRSR